MPWLFSMVALSLVMTVLTIAELRQPAKARAFGRPDLIFAVVTFAVSLIYGVILLATTMRLRPPLRRTSPNRPTSSSFSGPRTDRDT